MIFTLVRKIISTIVLLIVGALLWHFRDAWWPRVRRMLRKETGVDIRTQAEPPRHDELAPGVTWRSA